MANNEGVNIPIRTTFDGKGTGAATRSINELEKELVELRSEMKKVSVDSPDFVPLRDKTNALKEEIKSLSSAHEKGGASAANFGQGMLQGSRAVQDFSAAGIPGMVNNVEGIAAALGLGASAAGGFTLAFVGIDLLMRNWDKIFGDEKVTNAKEFWAAITPDEAATARVEAYNQALERQADHYERIATARKASIQAAREEDELMQKMAEAWKGITPDAAERGDLPGLPGTGPDSAAMREARRKQQEAQASSGAALDTFRSKDAAVQQQQGKVQAINDLATFDERFKLATAATMARMAELEKSIGLASQGGGVGIAPLIEERNRLQDEIKATRDQMRSGIKNVPGLTDGLTGDPEKDREQLQKRAQEERGQLKALEEERYQAAQRAEAAAAAQAAADRGVGNVQRKEQNDQLAGAYKDLGLPPAPGISAGSDERAGLTEAMQRLEQSRAQGIAAARELAGAADGVATDSAQMQQNMARAFSVMISTFRAMRGDLDGLASEFETYREANRR